MNYELALKLKEAGFPYSWCPGNYSCVPSLEELIEACGGKMFRLNNAEYMGIGWTARNEKIEGEKMLDFPTPTEAVANLWLEINKKKYGKDTNN